MGKSRGQPRAPNCLGGREQVDIVGLLGECANLLEVLEETPTVTCVSRHSQLRLLAANLVN